MGRGTGLDTISVLDTHIKTLRQFKRKDERFYLLTASLVYGGLMLPETQDDPSSDDLES